MSKNTRSIIRATIKELGRGEYEYSHERPTVTNRPFNPRDPVNAVRVVTHPYEFNVTVDQPIELELKCPKLHSHFDWVEKRTIGINRSEWLCHLEVEVDDTLHELLRLQRDIILASRDADIAQWHKMLNRKETMWSKEKSELQTKLDQLRSFWIVRLIEKFFI